MAWGVNGLRGRQGEPDCGLGPRGRCHSDPRRGPTGTVALAGARGCALSFLQGEPVPSIPLTDLGYPTISENLDHMFLLLPGHCLGMAFSNLYYNYELRKFCYTKNLNQTECDQISEGYTAQKNIHAWTSLGTGKYLATLAISGSVYLILRWLTETSVWWELKARCPGFYRKQKLGSGKQVSLQSTVSAPCDQDVEEEAKMIETCLEILCEKNPLVVKEGSEARQ